MTNEENPWLNILVIKYIQIQDTVTITIMHI